MIELPVTIEWREKRWLVTDEGDGRVKIAVQLEGASYAPLWSRAAFEKSVELGRMTIVDAAEQRAQPAPEADNVDQQ